MSGKSMVRRVEPNGLSTLPVEVTRTEAEAILAALARQALAAVWGDELEQYQAAIARDVAVEGLSRRVGARRAYFELERVEAAMADLLHKKALGRLEARDEWE